MAKTLFIVVRTVLAFAGIEVSEDTAKQIRQVCSWSNVKFTFPVLEDAVMDFGVLFLKYWRQLNNAGMHVSDDWLAKNMVRAFRQNRDENKFGGVDYLLKLYMAEEITNYLHTGCMIDFEISSPAYERTIRFVNGLLASKRLIIGKAGLVDRLSILMDLHVSQFQVKANEYGFATKVRLILAKEPVKSIISTAFAQAESEPANAEDQDSIEQKIAKEDAANGADAVGATIPTGFIPLSNWAAAAMHVAANGTTHPALQNMGKEAAKETAANVGVPLDKFNVKPEDIKRWQLLAIGNRIAAKEKAKHAKWEERKDIYPPSPEEVLKMLYDSAVENNIYRAMIVSRKEIEKAAAKEKRVVTEATVSSCTKSNTTPPKKDDIIITVGDKNISMRIHASRVYASYVRGDIRMKDDSKPAVKFAWGINPKTGKPYEELKAEKYDKVLKRVIQMRTSSVVDGQKVQGEEEKKNASILNCIIAKLKAMDLEPIANASINTWGQKGGK